MRIPKIIHQTWKTAEIPAHYRQWQQSWKTFNPAWEYRLWDDATIEEFIQREYPQFIALYKGYPNNISRIDLARYLILRTYGGVYADLDYECLKPIEGLLLDDSFVIGLEPDTHVRLEKAVNRGLKRLLCPTLIASIPAHPFWDHVLNVMPGVANSADLLDATGPFMLTRAYESFGDKGSIVLATEAQVYPFDKDECTNGTLLDIEIFEARTRSAYGIHYWEGTWWNSPKNRGGLPNSVQIQVTGKEINEPAPISHTPPKDAPMISCLMITRGRLGQASVAIRCFLAQTYSNKELVILDDATSDALEAHVAQLKQRDRRAAAIRYTRLEPTDRTLGDLRNLSVEMARGDYVAQWDDDDLSDPLRLQGQMRAIVATRAHGCMLSRWMLWLPHSRRAAVSTIRPWEGSLVCEKRLMPKYPHLKKGEDTEMIVKLMETARLARLDLPSLYVYVHHQSNTWDGDHFEGHWLAAKTLYLDERYDAVMEQLSRRIPIKQYEKHLGTLKPRELHALPATRITSSFGVNVFGHFSNSTGIAAAARGDVAALDSVGVRLSPIDIRLAEEIPVPHNIRVLDQPDQSCAFDLLHFNADGFLDFSAQDKKKGTTRLERSRSRYRIGFWAWESPNRVPKKMIECMDHFDEVWVPSEFTANALRPHATVPIVVMPHVVEPVLQQITREHYGMREVFVFATVFDATSNVTRKNPLATIRAYLRAFPTPGGVVLVLKGRRMSPAQHQSLVDAAKGRRDIIVINEEWPIHRTLGLIANCNCYVSLHRSEGFGLTMAEAMYFGKPVIATGYSGNLDFMTAENSMLVKYKLTQLKTNDGYYAAGTLWADADIDHAAVCMRTVVSNPEVRAYIGTNAASSVRTSLSATAVGGKMRSRFEAILAERSLSTMREADDMIVRAAVERISML